MYAMICVRLVSLGTNLFDRRFKCSVFVVEALHFFAEVRVSKQ